jgi:hypothetical protein
MNLLIFMFEELNMEKSNFGWRKLILKVKMKSRLKKLKVGFLRRNRMR